MLLAALSGAKLAEACRLPKVAGEICGGIVVGPTILGACFPEVYTYIFLGFPTEGPVLSVFYWFGLILLMFSSGYEARMDNLRGDAKIISFLAAGATAIPMLVGFYAAHYYFAAYYIAEGADETVFCIIVAIATAVTSLPVISKIFMDLGLIDHRFAKVILATATIQDLFLWIILSIATSIMSQSAVVPSDIALHIFVTIAIFVVSMVIAPRMNKIPRLEKLAIFSYDSIYFILCFACIFICSLFGVNIMYSAFAAGLIFRHIRNDDAVKAHAKLKDVCLAFFTPLYFSIVGLRIFITSDFSVSRFLFFLVLVSAVELAGCIIAMRIIRLSWLTSFNLGIAMNARGGPGIVLATVTYEMGIINYEFFCVLIFTTLVTSAVAGWWIDFINKRGKLFSIENDDDIIHAAYGARHANV